MSVIFDIQYPSVFDNLVATRVLYDFEDISLS